MVTGFSLLIFLKFAEGLLIPMELPFFFTALIVSSVGWLALLWTENFLLCCVLSHIKIVPFKHSLDRLTIQQTPTKILRMYRKRYLIKEEINQAISCFN